MTVIFCGVSCDSHTHTCTNEKGMLTVTGLPSSSSLTGAVPVCLLLGSFFFFLDRVQQIGNKLCALVTDGAVFFPTLMRARQITSLS